MPSSRPPTRAPEKTVTAMGLTTLLADNPPAGPQQMGAPALAQFAPFVLIFVVMYLFMIRPANKQRREQQAMLAAMKNNDKVLTSAGIIGIVVSFKEGDDEVTLKVDKDTNSRVRVLKSSIVRIYGDNPTTAEPSKA